MPVIATCVRVGRATSVGRNEDLESRMTGNCPVRFGGGPTEKAPQGDLAGGLSYWLSLATALADAGFAVSVINTAQAHYCAKALLKRAKTDAADRRWPGLLGAVPLSMSARRQRRRSSSAIDRSRTGSRRGRLFASVSCRKGGPPPVARPSAAAA